MNQRRTLFWSHLALWAVIGLIVLLFPEAAFAQDLQERGDLSPLLIASTIIYGIIGIAMCIVGYFAFDLLIGLNIKRELMEDQNMAIGIMLAGAFIGIGIVVAAVMVS